MTIFNYAKLGNSDKEAVLRNHALFIEQYQDGRKNICVYFYNNFFVEVTVEDGIATSYIPYRRGYKVSKMAPPDNKQVVTFKQAIKPAAKRKARLRSGGKK